MSKRQHTAFAFALSLVTACAIDEPATTTTAAALGANALELRPGAITISPGAARLGSARIVRQDGAEVDTYIWSEGVPPGLDLVIDEWQTRDLARFHIHAAPDLADGTYQIVLRAWSWDGIVDAATPMIVSVRTPGPTAVNVDHALAPGAPALAPYPDGAPRPLARVVDDRGLGLDFVTNELVIATDDDALLQGLLQRTRGSVLATSDPRQYGLQGAARSVLVRVDPYAADLGLLEGDLAALAGGARGGLRVSSDEGHYLLATGAREAAAGLPVSLNFVTEGADFVDRKLADGPKGWRDRAAGLADPDHTPNAFDWTTFRKDGAQHIGVAEAWRVLALAGKLGGAPIKTAILDGGFKNYDLPSFVGVSPNPFFGSFGSPNPASCGDHACPWHGTHVAQVGFGVPDNSYAGAGPGGPVSSLYLVHLSGYDVFSVMGSLPASAAAGAKIINMSFGARVPVLLSWSVLPFNAVTNAVRLAGTLIFASAGNAGEDVDEEDCFLGVCWEAAWHSPCENGGVTCVGGIDWKSRNRHANSNYGSDGDVDIFAPYVVYVGFGPDKLLLADDVEWGFGTSYASPFAAGVAALIWAADPSQGAGDVRARLIDNANWSSDGSVGRYVNAFASVHAVTGNVKPTVAITAPAPGATVYYGGLNTLTFTATAADVEDPGCCTVSWSSSVDGALGTGSTIAVTFPTVGTRTITAKVTDSAGLTSTASVTVTAINAAPNAPEIVKPAPSASVPRGTAYALEGRGFDLDELWLPCSRLTWTVTGPEPTLTATGCTPALTFTTAGTHYLALRATDELGLWTASVRAFEVTDPPPGTPVVTITQPIVEPGEPGPIPRLAPGAARVLAGTATDPDGDLGLTYRWSVIDGTVETVIGTTATLSWTPRDTLGPSCSPRTVTLRLRVTDSTGRTGTAELEVFIAYTIC